MRKRRNGRLLLTISILGFLMLSSSFVLMLIEDIGIVSGICFWAGILIGCIPLMILEAKRRAFFKSYHINRKTMQKPRNGMLSFGSNREAKVADAATLISAAAAVLALIITKGTGTVCYILIALTVFSFCMHCVFNGRIYFHVNNQKRIRQALEQKKAKMESKGERKR